MEKSLAAKGAYTLLLNTGFSGNKMNIRGKQNPNSDTLYWCYRS